MYFSFNPSHKGFISLAGTFCVIGLSLPVHAESPVTDTPIILAESPVSDSPKVDSAVYVEGETEQWSIHGQSTYIVQQKNNFNSPYYGQNSLLNKSEGAGGKSYTLSATAFLGARLWEGAEVYWNPEMFEGTPFNGQLVGLGGFQNGELQKGSYAPPIYYTARAFIRQTFGLGGVKSILKVGPISLLAILIKIESWLPTASSLH